MAGSVTATPGFDLQPSAERVPVATNYITNFDFLNQYLPDTYEKEFERYGNRSDRRLPPYGRCRDAHQLRPHQVG